MAQQFRSNDAVLTVCQNNQKQAIEICAASPTALALLGAEGEMLTGKDFLAFLPLSLVEDVKDYVEFEEGANDIGTVLSRMKDFRILNRRGETVPVSLKAIRTISPDRNDWFKLILRAPAHENAKEKLLALLQQNFKGHEVLDETLGLPDRNSLIKNAELVAYHAQNGSLQASFAIIELDRYVDLNERYSRTFSNRALKGIADLARQNLRAYDMAGTLEGADLGLLLLDITPESARVVLNRLRWLIKSKLPGMLGVPEGEIGISIAFRSMTDEMQGRDMVLECERLLAERDAKSHDAMIEATHSGPTHARHG